MSKLKPRDAMHVCATRGAMPRAEHDHSPDYLLCAVRAHAYTRAHAHVHTRTHARGSMHAGTHWPMQLAHTNATHEQMIDGALNQNGYHRHHHSYFDCQRHQGRGHEHYHQWCEGSRGTEPWPMQLAHTNATRDQMIDDALNHHGHQGRCREHYHQWCFDNCRRVRNNYCCCLFR